MPEAAWDDLVLDSASDEDGVWELFHENSKVDRHGHHVPDDEVAVRMLQMAPALDYEGAPAIDLPRNFDDFTMPLWPAIVSRVTPQRIEPAPIPVGTLAAILFAGCGVTRSNRETNFLRPFRTAPSGGALYPLELYVVSKHISCLTAGLYHYNAAQHGLRRLRSGDFSIDLSRVLVEFQAHLAFDATAIVMITALFGRSTFKYGARGYRFVLLEAGHVAQNINLAVTAMGMGCFNIGGFYDRAADRFLGIDGLNQSTIYMIAIGKLAALHEPPLSPPGAAPQ
ncbi:MAG: SagB family peptide dehydrogenase [Gammaproteobacteria bacterium]|nr:SagB family peptide dehydrogenase [Gammaproteobacteria bacterium]